MPGKEIQTTRFGRVAIEADDAISFPGGILGLSDASHWVLLAEAHNDTLGWLQSTVRPEQALAVVNPRRFVNDYQIRVTRTELSPLALTNVQDAHVLVIVSKSDKSITLNLKAPLLVNLTKRVGAQVLNTIDYPVQHPLAGPPVVLKKSA